MNHLLDFNSLNRRSNKDIATHLKMRRLGKF
jgi:hypothetical protein